MKKILVLVLSLMLALSITACSSTKTPEKVDTSNQTETTPVLESEYPFPSNITEEIGNGRIYVSTPSGTSENGNIPIEYVDTNTVICQIGLSLMNFEGDKQVFIYVDKTYNKKVQAGFRTDTTITLSEDLLNPGIHTVTAVQFENNDPLGRVIEYHETKFEIKK